MIGMISSARWFNTAKIVIVLSLLEKSSLFRKNFWVCPFSKVDVT